MEQVKLRLLQVIFVFIIFYFLSTISFSLQLHLKKPWVRGKSLQGFSLAAMTALLMSCSPSGPRCCPWRCGQIWWMAQGLIGGYHQAGLAHWEGGGGDNEVAEILGGLFGRNLGAVQKPRLTLVSFNICSKLSLNTLDNHFIPFLTGQQSSQLRSMPKNCAFYTNDGNLR